MTKLPLEKSFEERWQRRWQSLRARRILRAMATFNSSGAAWTLDIHQNWIDITSGYPTPNERWRATDSNGHEHFYDHGYPTLTDVVDAEHWCDGTEGIALHDPHMAVDASHYECTICREVVKPALDPPGKIKMMPGLRSATLTATVDGLTKTMTLTDEEVETVRAAADNEEAALALWATIPDERVLSREYNSH